MALAAPKIILRFCVLLLALQLFPVARLSLLLAQDTVLELDASQTKIEYTLKSNVDTVHGTFKLKRGTIHFDPATRKMSGAIVVDATSAESGNDSRDKRMHTLILESQRYPEIVFTPARMSETFSSQSASKVEVSGQFKLHGQEHEVTFPIEVRPGEQQLQMATQIMLPYLDWGLKNPNRFGILRVNDKVELSIHAVAKFAASESILKK